ncbi:Skp1 family, dimerization domain-containing protein [Jimgerdemannia flammicorona]|uniref:E3 ubiquitin ligase complex SCF subunit n=1 Tax=Jimgerdemannia flammicorona TaxID=994334 RepID=A0A433DFE9_9FUNG|nr:Skp1 family, dimerization domain-containing protein [Jimgerdemannia flammicorona]
MTTKVTLISLDNKNFPIDKEVAKRSVFIKNMLEDVSKSDALIPLPNVNSKVLRKVIKWYKHHHTDPRVPTDKNTEDQKRGTDIEDWDQKFIEVDQETLFEIILATNYLDINPLLDVSYKTITNMIKSKSPEEIHKTFNIVSDFILKEEAQSRKENKWDEDQ